MKNSGFKLTALASVAVAVSVSSLVAQNGNDFAPPFDRPEMNGPRPPGRDGFAPGGPGPMEQEIKLVDRFDKNADGRLDTTERKAAREFVSKQRASRPQRGPGGPPGFARRETNQSSPQPGVKVAPADVKSVYDAPLYDPQTVRTLFLQFENADWEKELADFHDTDVEVPVTLMVDGNIYRNTGVHFRGASSFMMIGEGWKRSLNLSLDFVDENQRLHGHRTLNLLNSHEDPTFLRTVLYSHIARQYVPAPKANFVRVVINGESWGIYVSAEQFNKDFIKEWFSTTKGARWKVSGSPQGRGGLEYLGDNPEPYKRIYDIKSKDEPQAWADLIKLCKTLNETPSNKLEQALAPMLDIEGVLKFLALENALINNDGYWIRASDYSLYQDGSGRFHVIPHDMNETFSLPGGPGFGGPRGDGSARVNGVEVDPLHAAGDARKPLLSKLLAVPSLRARYLGYVRDIAKNWLDWKKLGPLAEQYQSLIAADVKADTRKLDSFEAFKNGVAGETQNEPNVRRGPPTISLKNFVEQRRAYLLKQTSGANVASR